MSSINYIIAVYAGKRRHYSITPVKLFIDKHVNYIKSCSSNISQVTFIINKSDPAVDNELKEYINLKELDIPVTIIIRPNIDGSYGAWEAGLTHKENTSEYSFLIEDDYIPVRADSINFFENKINDKISYVSSLWREDHSSISNGLFNNKFIKPTVEAHGNLFELCRNANTVYGILFHNQRNFLNLIDGKNNIDITDVGHTMFLESPGNYLIYNNDKLPLLIEPII